MSAGYVINYTYLHMAIVYQGHYDVSWCGKVLGWNKVERTSVCEMMVQHLRPHQPCRIKDLFFSWSRGALWSPAVAAFNSLDGPHGLCTWRECRSGVVNRVWFHLEFMVLNQLKKFEASSGLMDFIVSWGRPLPSSPIHQERETLLLDTFRIF
jgi:hypothetical protein